MKLHNKFEIVAGGKTIATAFNQMFPSVLQAIESYVGFAKYLAIGGKLGDTQSELSDTTLQNALAIYRTQEVEFQLNPLAGTMQAKRKITIGESALVGAEISCVGFCSLPSGITDDEQSDLICNSCSPALYNFAEIKNALGEKTKFVKGSEEIEIVSTLYLDWETSQGVLPLGGDNKFIKFLLGSDSYGAVAPSFDFGVGCDHRSNEKQVEQDYIYSKRYMNENVLPTVTRTNKAIEFLFAASTVSSVLTCELALAANDQVVIRQNRERFKTEVTTDESLTSSEYGVVTLQKFNSGEIVKVTNRSTHEVIYDTPEQIAQLTKIQYPSLLSDPRAYYFGEDKDYYTDNGWRTFESKCGDMIAFVSADTLDMYGYDDGVIKKNTSAVSDVQSITDIQFFDDLVFVIKSAAPYVDMYKIKDNVLVKTTLRLAEAITKYASDFSFTNSVSQKISIGRDAEGIINVVIKFDADNVAVFGFEAFGRIYECTKYFKPELTSIGVFGALLARGTEKGYVVLTGVDSTTYPNVYTFTFADGYRVVESAIIANDFSSNVVEYRVGASFIHVRRSSASYNPIWYFDGNLRRIKPSDDANIRYFINNKGNLAFRGSMANTSIYGVFIRENGAPITFLSSVVQDDFASWREMHLFGNAGVIIRDTQPHCMFIQLGDYGYTTLKGLPPSTNLLVTSKLSLPQYERDNCRNFLMSLIVEIGDEQ